jgi:glycosyltransferase involved in cell wall biosynthesis
MSSQGLIAILHYASPPVIGGVESTIFHHARTIADLGYQVRVISGRGQSFDNRVSFSLLPEAGSRHPEVLSVGKELARGNVTETFTSLRERLVEQLSVMLEPVQVLIVHNALSLHKNLALTAALAELAQNGQPRMIAWCHDFAWLDELYAHELHPGYPWDLLRKPWPRVQYVAVSQDRRSDLVALLGLREGQVRVITPGVPVSDFLGLTPVTRRLVAELDLFFADPVLLLPARITRRKNIEFAIKVIAALVDRKPQAALVVTGPPGPHNPKNAAYLAALADLAARLGVSDQVHFLYRMGRDGQPFHPSNAVLSEFYRVADLMIFPSLREGFGIPALEAGLSRLPVFASDISPVRASTAGMAHLFDQHGNPEDVADAILEFLSRDRAYLLRRHILENYTWKRVIEQGLLPLLEQP